jgi:hypothetical protein
MNKWFVFYVPEHGEARLCNPEFADGHETQEGAQAEANFENEFNREWLKKTGACYEARYYNGQGI